MPFDSKGTIGGLPCERSLNQILADRDDPKLIRKIIKLLQYTKFRLKCLKAIDKTTRRYFVTLLKRDSEQILEGITGVKVRGVPVVEVLTSHTMCCLHAYFADAYREMGRDRLKNTSENGPVV